ncbi:RHS repeat-associated core domain-containing protein [Dongia sp. agr-C8]
MPYDTAGRIASRGGSLFKSVLPTATTATAAYNADNQLTSWNGTTISYDLNGNLTNDGTRSFTWDARNRLTAITGVASFVYDGVDRRQSVTQGAATTAVVYDGYEPVQEQSPVGTVSANLRSGLGVDEWFSRTKGGVTSTYLTDQLGSTMALANGSGVVQTSYGYDPYGVTSQSGAANDNPYQFTGRQNDGTGLYYYRARYYNPTWGRFINEDPIGLAGGISLYGYVSGNPINNVDPFGECPPCLAVVVVAEGGAEAGAIAAAIGEVAAAVRGAMTVGSIINMAQNNKATRNKIASLQKRIDEHQKKLDEDPDCPPANHWRKEINGWKERIQRLQKRLPGG